MAIKGKAKTKSKPKQVTRGPKPAYVEVKPPWFGRKRVQLFIALLVGLGIYLFGIWATNGLREQKAEKEAKALKSREATAVQQYVAMVDTQLQNVGTTNPQQPGAFAFSPSADAEAFGAAGKAIGKVDLAGLVQDKGFTFKISQLMFRSREGMARGLRLQEQAVLLLEQANGVHGDLRAQLIDRAKEVATLAGEIFTTAYQDYYQMQVEAGVAPQASAGAFPGGVPGFQTP